MDFKLTQYFKISNHSVSSSLDNETIILNSNAGVYYGLDEVGTLVWEELQQKSMNTIELTDAVMQVFEIDEATCNHDISLLLKRLLDEKLVEKV